MTGNGNSRLIEPQKLINIIVTVVISGLTAVILQVQHFIMECSEEMELVNVLMCFPWKHMGRVEATLHSGVLIDTTPESSN